MLLFHYIFYYSERTKVLNDLASQKIKENSNSIKVPKPRWRAKTPSYYKDIITDNMDGYDYLNQFSTPCHTICILKAEFLHPTSDPAFHCVYNPADHKAELIKNLNLKGCPTALQSRVTEFVKSYWDIFREAGVQIPVRGYEMVIDTGTHAPVKVPLPRYGLHEA